MACVSETSPEGVAITFNPLPLQRHTCNGL
jgi:hypothetical protein